VTAGFCPDSLIEVSPGEIRIHIIQTVEFYPDTPPTGTAVPHSASDLPAP
jgi:hypothetical protein